MKICWDNLEKLRYSTKTGNWYYGQNTYKIKNCKYCGSDFLGAKPNQFCDIICSNFHKHKSGVMDFDLRRC